MHIHVDSTNTLDMYNIAHVRTVWRRAYEYIHKPQEFTCEGEAKPSKGKLKGNFLIINLVVIVMCCVLPLTSDIYQVFTTRHGV